MRWTPGQSNDKIKIDETRFTEGNEFMELDGKNYRGYIHKIGKLYFSGKFHDDNSKPLIPYNPKEFYITYLKYKGWFYKNFTDPKDYLPAPTEKDYKNGNIERFFIKLRNQNQSRIVEVDEKQFKSLKNKDAGLDGNRYFGISFKWKITGPRNDVKFGTIVQQKGVWDTNKKVLEIQEKNMPGISKHLNNYIQFARLD